MRTLQQKLAGNSWQTTAAGVAAFLAVLFRAIAWQFDQDPETVADWNQVVSAGLVMVALWRARDNDKSSEQVVKRAA